MSHKNLLKIIQMGPEAERIACAGFKAAKNYREIDMDLRKAHLGGASAQAIMRYRRNVYDKRLDIVEKLVALKALILEYAPKGADGKPEEDFGWMQNALNAALKNKAAEILLNNKEIDPVEIFKYMDAAERRSLEAQKLAIEKERMETEKIKASAELKNAETKAKIAEAKLDEIKSLARKAGDKKIGPEELLEIMERTYGI